MKIDVSNFDSIIQEIKKHFGNLTPVYESIGLIWLSAINRNFQSEGAYFNAKWAPLKPATIKRKDKDNILENTGGFQSSFGYNVNAEGLTLTAGTPFGAEQFVSAVHHYGSDKMNIPARPLFPLGNIPQDIIEEMAETIVLFLSD